MARNHSEPLNRRIRQSRFESPQHEAMLGLLVAAGHLRERIEAVCARHQVTGGQYNVLRVLRGAHPGGYPRWDIARRLIERAPDVTRLIDRLADNGWVDRARSDSDRRLSVTRITAKGLKLLERMQGEIDAIQEDLARRLPDRDARALAELCARLYDVGTEEEES